MIGTHPSFVGEILIQRPLGDPGLGHHAVQGRLMIALVGELRQAAVSTRSCFVKGQVPKSREGRFLCIYDQLVISNMPANCQACGTP